MRIEIIEPDGDLRREVWTFVLLQYWPRFEIVLDRFVFSDRTTKRHKWVAQNWWNRPDNRLAPMQTRPEPPAHIVKQAREQICQAIMDCEVK